MHKYLVERNIPNVGKMNRDQLVAAATKSNQVLDRLGSGIHWQESYVSGDQMFCLYFAKDKDLVRKHADMAGFPADRIIEIQRTVDPALTSLA